MQPPQRRTQPDERRFEQALPARGEVGKEDFAEQQAEQEQEHEDIGEGDLECGLHRARQQEEGGE